VNKANCLNEFHGIYNPAVHLHAPWLPQALADVLIDNPPAFLCRIFGADSETGKTLLIGRDINAHLRGARMFALFAATLGFAADRAILRASVAAPAQALALDKGANILIEAVCDEVCESIAREYPDMQATKRYSPGYGDYPLAVQPALLSALDAHRRLGITLTDALLMLPTKTVTAVVGLKTV
jgi:hypothetical protein